MTDTGYSADCNLKARQNERLITEIEQLRNALANIAALDYTRAATTGACALAVNIAKEALRASPPPVLRHRVG